MKAVVDSYIGIWLLMLFLMLCIGFTSINLNVIQARKMYNDIKAQVQASNGTFVDAGTNMFSYDSRTAGADSRTLANDHYEYSYTVTRKPMRSTKYDNNETWIYNDIYLIDFEYTYLVPLFGRQVYPMVGYTY